MGAGKKREHMRKVDENRFQFRGNSMLITVRIYFNMATTSDRITELSESMP